MKRKMEMVDKMFLGFVMLLVVVFPCIIGISHSKNYDGESVKMESVKMITEKFLKKWDKKDVTLGEHKIILSRIMPGMTECEVFFRDPAYESRRTILQMSFRFDALTPEGIYDAAIRCGKEVKFYTRENTGNVTFHSNDPKMIPQYDEELVEFGYRIILASLEDMGLLKKT